MNNGEQARPGSTNLRAPFRLVAILLCTIILFYVVCYQDNAVLPRRTGAKTVRLLPRNQMNVTQFPLSVNAPPVSHRRNTEGSRSIDKKIKRRLPSLRSLEDSNEENDNNEENEDADDDENQNNQEGNQNDEERENSRDRGPGHDDFFREFIEDDDLGVQTEAYYHWDDSYFSWDVIDTKPQLLPLDKRKLVGFFVAFVGMLLGASGGAGGGGVVVPIYILVLGLPIQAAIPVGAITILGAALAATILNWHRRHPLADRVLIDWDLILIMEPVILVGTLVGTLVHRLLNDKFLVVLLVILLSFAAHTTLAKAIRMYHAENRYLKHLRAQEDNPLSGCPSFMSAEENLSSIHTAKAELANGGFITYNKLRKDEMDKMREMHKQPSYRQPNHDEKEEILILNPDYITLRSELLEQEKFAPRSKIVAVLGIVIVLAFLTIMVGGGSQFTSPWGIECGSLSFWIVHVIMIAFLVSSAWAAQTYVIARHEIKKLVRFDYVHGDIQWDSRSAITYPAVFVMAGLFAGTLGIGGGVITVPMMLAMGVHPGVVSATSAAMIMFTSFATTTTFSIFGLMLPDFAVVGFFIGFCASFVGGSIMRRARQANTGTTGGTFDRYSYTAFATGGVVLVSALLMTVQYIFIIVNQPFEERGLCDGTRY